MKHLTCITCAMIAITCLPGLAGADVFTPDPADLLDMEHGHFYIWGINWSVPTGETIVGASLFFDNIRNWDDSTNDLWVHLFDTAPLGTGQYTDSDPAEDDEFATEPGTLLEHYVNLPATAQDITYTFSDSELLALKGYVADGLFGLGFDPDCHFYNDGVSLTIETQTVPLPGALLLGGLGLSSAVAALRRRRQA